MTWVVFIFHKWSLIFAQVMLYDPKQPGVFGLHLFLVQPHMKVGLSAPKNNCPEDLSCYSSLSRRPWKTIQQHCIFSGKYKTAVDGSEIRPTRWNREYPHVSKGFAYITAGFLEPSTVDTSSASAWNFASNFEGGGGPVGSSHIPTRWTQKAAIGFSIPPVTPFYARPFIGGAKTPCITSRVSHLEQVSPFNLQDFCWDSIGSKELSASLFGYHGYHPNKNNKHFQQKATLYFLNTAKKNINFQPTQTLHVL